MDPIEIFGGIATVRAYRCSYGAGIMLGSASRAAASARDVDLPNCLMHERSEKDGEAIAWGSHNKCGK